MSEPIPESVPTSHDPRSRRPVKRRALDAHGQQAAQLDALFAQPDKAVVIPPAGGKPRALPPPPEIVTNVQGSSAGAGSGEFHVYKASRRREFERLRMMEEEVKQEEDAASFERDQERRRAQDDAKTSKNKARRDKAKQRKAAAAAQRHEPSADDADSASPAKETAMANGTTKSAKKIVLPSAVVPRATSHTVSKELLSVEDSTAHAQGVIIHDDD